MSEFVKSTQRVEKLLKTLKTEASRDRSNEWFEQDELQDVSINYFKYTNESYSEKENPDKVPPCRKYPVIIRKAFAIDEMLTKMTDETVSSHTHTYEIKDGELIVGIMPMGSNGLGKVFPNYLTEDEKRAASYTNKSELSILGHNTVNYNRLLSGGLEAIMNEAEEKVKELNKGLGLPADSDQVLHTIPMMVATNDTGKIIDRNRLVSKREFYTSVWISCQAVKEYAERFGKLSKKMADETSDPVRKGELLEIERVCNKVPYSKPDTFFEALQSIYFFHVALHASMNFISLGRLDQVLYPFYQRDIEKCTTKEEREEYNSKVVEYLECFIIKGAGRLNLTTDYLLNQDHMDNNAALGVHPYYLDQRAGVNNFLQNIIIGGMTPDGKQADNEVTYCFLNAFANVNLSTPGIYVRMGSNSTDKLKEAVAVCLSKTKNLPGILNDDMLIPALKNSLLPYENTIEGKSKMEQLINDYCVDGCWEPILNGECDWTFGMPSCLTVFQCAINQGAVLDTNIGMLRGSKVSFRSPQVKTYDEMKKSFQKYMQFFIDQSTFTLYECYTMDEFVTPSPLFSAVLGQCMKKGRDKGWGGAGYNIGGTILTGVPDTINNIAAIKKFVFDEGKYDIEDVKQAMINNFKEPLVSAVANAALWKEMKHDFDYNCPKFGDGSEEIEEIGKFVIDTFCDAVENSKEFTDKIYLNSIADYSEEEKNEIRRLRKISGYSGSCFKRRFGKDFAMRFTAGCGTFEGYPQQGLGVVATANRNNNDPIIANFSPSPGTIRNGIGNVFKTLSQMPMNRMSAGAITDLCIDDANSDMKYVKNLLNGFIENNGCMLTLSFGNRDVYQKIYTLSYDLIYGDDVQKEYARNELPKYSDIVVRVGGWQAPFISMSLAQQQNYILRIVNN